MFMIIENMPFNTKKIIVIFFDACLLFFCFVTICYIFKSEISYVDCAVGALFALVNIAYLSYQGGYEVIWNLFDVNDGKRIAVSLVLTSMMVCLLGGLGTGLAAYGFLVLLSFNALTLLRGLYANWRSLFRESLSREHILILGAGEAGAQLFKSLKKDVRLGLNPVGFLDDHLRKQKFKISNAPVFGTIDDLSRVAIKMNIKKAVVAIPSASNKEMQRIVNIANSAGVQLRSVPSLKNILNGTINPLQLKEIEPEDLLGRESVILDQSALSGILTNKRVLVTGAGGSIGTELCNQICKFSPATLVLFEQSEFSLYDLNGRLSEVYPNVNIVPLVGDVREYQDIDLGIRTHQPDIVFHAAAYKHVPLMEINPFQAIRANVLGTQNVVKAVGVSKIARFILVSTDKAVNPTNIMGATKRVAEIVCQIESKKCPDTKFMAVRFGNVLGSSGSVIPLFKKQILAGGPVTVTHKDIVRYFMSIPEACQLVLQASVLGEGGEIFVLKMGDPIKITHLAEEMIRLSGLQIDIDISIKYTGLRPGEKLYEELLADGETTNATQHTKILIATNRGFDAASSKYLANLLALAPGETLVKISEKLKQLVPEFNHNSNYDEQ